MVVPTPRRSDSEPQEQIAHVVQARQQRERDKTRDEDHERPTVFNDRERDETESHYQECLHSSDPEVSRDVKGLPSLTENSKEQSANGDGREGPNPPHHSR